MLHFQGNVRGARLPVPPGQGLPAPVPAPAPGGQHQHPPRAPGRAQGRGGILVPASGTALPPHASLQLSLKTEKNVLVFLLLLSSYETPLVTKSLNKSQLLKRYLKSAALQSPSQFQTFNLLRLE